MILSAQSIRNRRIFDPFNERARFKGVSFGLSAAGYDVRIRENLNLAPGQFALASTMEHFRMPADVLGMVADKSTWARLGMAVQNTIIEPGWRGWLTLELTNHGRETLHIYSGQGIAQIILQLLDQPTTQPYEGKYQDQKKGVQPAVLEQD
jgi:dCTP deaminase